MSIPRMSLILPTLDTFATIRRTINSLRGQTIVGDLELVIVTPTLPQAFGLDVLLLRDFHSYQVVQTDHYPALSRLYAAGVVAAHASVVAFTEDHVFHAPDWAEHLLKSHEGPYAAVGAQIANANPASLLSLSDFLIGYGVWSAPIESGPRDYIPGHNSSYKRDVLLAYGDTLAKMIASEVILHWELRAKGHQLYLNADAKMHHMNFSKWSPWLRATFYEGCNFAANRTQGWPLFKRLAYAGASPLIPFVRIRRLWPAVRKTSVFPQIVAVLLMQLFVSAFGECIGSLFDRRERYVAALYALETLRDKHVRPSDLELENLQLPEGINLDAL